MLSNPHSGSNSSLKRLQRGARVGKAENENALTKAQGEQAVEARLR